LIYITPARAPGRHADTVPVVRLPEEDPMSAPIRTLDEFHAHALAIEREAAARYREFAARMADHDKEDLAALFAKLSRMEQEHAQLLEDRMRGTAPAELPAGAYRWLDAGAPETAAHDWIFRLLTPYDALRIALAGEQRARDFFQRVAAETDNAELRAFALEMAEEEVEHAARLERALAHEPDPHIDWEQVLEARAA
jgi:rubrerythrin